MQAFLGPSSDLGIRVRHVSRTTFTKCFLTLLFSHLCFINIMRSECKHSLRRVLTPGLRGKLKLSDLHYNVFTMIFYTLFVVFSGVYEGK